MNEVNEKDEQWTEEQPVPNEGAATPEAEESKAGEDFEQKYRDTYDQYVRLFAEFDNYKKRAVKERMEFAKTAGADVVSAILPALDDFDRAAKSFGTVTEIQPLKEGVDLIHKKLWKALSDKGLEEVLPKTGDVFDADIHEAITQIPAPDESLKGKVLDVLEKGFALHGKIIRYPKVVVGA
eukprot:gene47983-58777_t